MAGREEPGGAGRRSGPAGVDAANPTVSFRVYTGRMSASLLVRYVNPWRFRRQQNEARITSLRHRDGDTCKRCKRPMRFDLPDGHDLMPRIEEIEPGAAGAIESLDNLCLTHVRCNAKHGCDTAEVKERARIKHEAALFAKSKQKRRRAQAT